MTIRRLLTLAFLTILCSTVALAQAPAPSGGTGVASRYRMGHSAHGKAFDEGPRERPARMDGIGTAHFPISTKHPEVQAWFDQGYALLLSFWFYEAERTFRWCLQLEPDNAMAYWGLARASEDGDRRRAFLKEALARRDKVTPRERAWLEAYDTDRDSGGSGGGDGDRGAFKRALERLVLAYPDDVEAKVTLAEVLMGQDRMGAELLLKSVLAVAPDHPAGHHYRIHNWDGPDGAQALDSCRRYGAIAPRIGHALHMPGHVYAGLGMFHEAAISLDSATRAEIRYMGERMVFPYNTWNYAHNRNYLSYVQEQLGLVSEAVRGARELLAVPLDPKLNDKERFSPHWQGLEALTRALVRFERWDEVLDEDAIPWSESLRDRGRRAFVEALAHLGKGDRHAAADRVAAHSGLKEDIDKPDNAWFKPEYETQAAELEGRLALARGDTFKGLARLADAAEKELRLRDEYDDPPGYPGIGYVTLGRAYLDAQSPSLARAAFEKALGAVPSDPFALAGLTQAQLALGARDAAEDTYARLQFVWSDAEPGLRVWTDVQKLGLTSAAKDASPGPQRNYRRERLDAFGPAIWAPNPAPALDVVDAEGRRVTLSTYRGKNVLLVFYLGGSCVHCMKQLRDIAERKDDLAGLDTVLLAVSSDTPAVNKSAQRGFAFTLLSDPTLEMTKRFKSHDDFENAPIHSTMLIDRDGRLHWAQHGGAPFGDVDFLIAQLKRMNESRAAAVARPTG
jgi:peroxiredoxin/tetratricopeptide (TPR) repeat protein